MPSGLVRPTRAIWQSWHVPALSALLPALPGTSRIRLRSASTGLLRQPGAKAFHLLRLSAPHGAQALRGAPSSGCQSRPVHASRENLVPSTMPTRPIVTSVTSRAKTAQGIGRRGRYLRVVVDHHDPRQRPAQRRRPLGQRVLQPRRFGMLKNLLPARLVHHRGPVPVLGSDLLLRLAPRPVPSQAYRAGLPPRGPRIFLRVLFWPSG